MLTRPFSYLIGIQYLGLRYHGWQVQKGVKTIQGTLERVFRYVLGHEDFTILGSSRTDSGVSCLQGAFVIYLREAADWDELLKYSNEHLPADIRLLYVKAVDRSFNVIQHVAKKRYGYYFSLGEKPHPFQSGALAYAGRGLDIALMREAAALFVGRHDFRRFCTHGKQLDDFVREIYVSELLPLDGKVAFWPREDAYVFRVDGNGFLMHQVRRMVAALFMVGRGELSVQSLAAAFVDPTPSPVSPKAAPQGLVLEEVFFNGI
ncbi:MAG: tRNA pseudouridine(38-40) synthase TruA [Lunatimonas sp.]|uniref:tRNA pseudouridine(38-40) synthase TruA n=1 Tax=Lunatimonas sp. TaxID=2060141 RepID=UPI00263BC8CA|nr:tRNA pseudouridine(38-40) synthase TruA [Lunatimonas sp.]MCC5937528.1 tRNA pseudouridine(38-40) synthase TruA [Lunatimonas sp.]